MSKKYINLQKYFHIRKGNYMKKTKVPIIVSVFLWVTNIGKLLVAKNLLKWMVSMAKNKIYLCENIFHTMKTYIQNLSVVFYMLIIRRSKFYDHNMSKTCF